MCVCCHGEVWRSHSFLRQSVWSTPVIAARLHGGFRRRIFVLVSSLREGEMVVLAAVLWRCGVNVLAWSLLRLASPFVALSAMASKIGRLPVAQLCKYVWPRIPSRAAPLATETQRLTEQTRHALHPTKRILQSWLELLAGNKVCYRIIVPTF